ncbi:MAG: sugar ABC transporter permease [Clostridiales bacterium]|nr:MAG: sugar ABC transporter permease [Clostridiales bacterium]PIE77140.1 MAG: sugar ABC transporter permease [Clostridiales bacterium]
MSLGTILSIFNLTLIYATPILIASLGGLLSERSGVVNIALEGLMMIGGFVGATATVLLEPYFPGFSAVFVPWIGMLLGMVFGALFSVIHAYVSVNLKADQVISGTAINLLAGGVTIYFAQIIFNQQRTKTFQSGFVKGSIPILKDIPIIGPILFDNVFYSVYLGLFLVLLVWFLVYKTPFGMRLRATGENPHAVASTGISVVKMRYWGVVLSGAFAGMAGAIMVLTLDTQYTVMSIHGTGFIALAALIFGKWRPFGVLGASMFFAFSQVFAIFANNFEWLAAMPLELFKALPYVFTVVALIIFSGKSVGPKAAGEIYDIGKR